MAKVPHVVALLPGDVLVYQGMEIDQNVLDAILNSTNKRLLWAFVRKGNNVMAVPYTENECVWMAAEDVRQPNDVDV